MLDQAMIGETQVKVLQSSLRGRLVTPKDEDYDTIRDIYNGMIDRRPTLIAQCVDIADVIAAVSFARDNRIPLAIRSGGHNGAGLALVDDGLVIDLSPMKGIRVDAKVGTVQVEGGCVWGDVDHATHRHGGAERLHFHHRRWRTHARGRAGLPHP